MLFIDLHWYLFMVIALEGKNSLNPIALRTAKTQFLTLLHSEQPKLSGVLAFLSAIGLKQNLIKTGLDM